MEVEIVGLRGRTGTSNGLLREEDFEDHLNRLVDALDMKTVLKRRHDELLEEYGEIVQGFCQCLSLTLLQCSSLVNNSTCCLCGHRLQSITQLLVGMSWKGSVLTISSM